MGQGALSKPVVQWWLSLNSSRYRTRSEAIDIPSCGAGGRTRLFR